MLQFNNATKEYTIKYFQSEIPLRTSTSESFGKYGDIYIQTSRPRIAIFKAEIDPITTGQIQILRELSKRFDKVILMPVTQFLPASLFRLEDQLEVVRHLTQGIPNLKVTEHRNETDLMTLEYMTEDSRYEYTYVVTPPQYQCITQSFQPDHILKNNDLLLITDFRYVEIQPLFPVTFLSIPDLKNINQFKVREQLRNHLKTLYLGRPEIFN